MGKEKICFVISPIGEPESDIRKRSDQVFKHIISPAVEPLGYKPLRADQISKPGIITSQVMQHVIDSPLVIADLTGHNPNVFYELAIRHGIRTPFIQIISEGEKIPFDVAGLRTIEVDVRNLDSVEEAKKELVRQVKSIEQGEAEIDTPISVAVDLRILRGSEDPQKLSFADIKEAISELGSRILSLETILTRPKIELGPESIYSFGAPAYPQPAIFFDKEGRLLNRGTYPLGTKEDATKEEPISKEMGSPGEETSEEEA